MDSDDAKHGDDTDEATNVVTVIDSDTEMTLAPRSSSPFNAVPPPNARPIRIELPWMSEEARSEFKTVHSQIVERIRSQAGYGNYAVYDVEFSDCRIEQIRHNKLLTYENAEEALYQFMEDAGLGVRSRKRRIVYDNSSEEESDNTIDSSTAGQRRVRRQVHKSVNLKELSKASVQQRTDSDEEDLLSGHSSDEDAFLLPGSTTRRLKRRVGKPSNRNAIMPTRRSARTNRSNVTMVDDWDYSDDDYDEPDSAQQEERASSPKIRTMKEIFENFDLDHPFAAVHSMHCQSCSKTARHGQMVYCQGCSSSIHKMCLGPRSARDHRVTKIGEDTFVMQCKYCIKAYPKNDPIAPSYSCCQGCKGDGKACEPFSEKKTPKQEENLRQENDGQDPITTVAKNLINNADNVLFRCPNCYRAWHQEHLPLFKQSDDGDEQEYASSLERYLHHRRCNQCRLADPVHRIVAWRPKKELAIFEPGLQYRSIPEDSKEYLIKWVKKSYFACSWVSGSWLYGAVHGSMRTAFAKRADTEDLCKANRKDAIPRDYLAADVILAVRMKNGTPEITTKENALSNVSNVHCILVKFRGLGYDDVVWDTPPSADIANLYTFFQDAYSSYMDGQFFAHEPIADLRQRMKDFRNRDVPKLEEQPAAVQNGTLMPYQMEGLNWLMDNFHQDKNIILADDMGLGKTVQGIALIASLVTESPRCWPFLVVVPNATCGNWRREFKKWTPDLRVVSFHGGTAAQDLTYKYELFPNKTKHMRAHVVIMSYESAQDPHTKTLFSSIRWVGLVVDEGQRLKTETTLLYKALSAMRVPFRLLLTGTPLQNNKRELFNLLQFIDDTQDANQLDQEYEVLTKDNLPLLHQKIRPYFLRRTKAGVLTFLPPLRQIIVPVTMTKLQEKLSKSIMERSPELIQAIYAKTKLEKNERSNLNNILMQLRKCLCHPFIYSDAIEEQHHDPLVIHQNFVQASAKLILLDAVLPKLKEAGHRVLIFSQFLDELTFLEDFLAGMGLPHKRLDGTMDSLAKQKCIDAFNAPKSPLFALLLSTRAGGVGINLATADTVIIMGPDFNPHQDMQAISRAHRIGQTKPVLCMQLMTKGTVDERIMQAGRSKLALDQALIETMDDEDLEAEDLESILRHGAAALFNEDYQKSAIHYTSVDLDKLLDRSDMEIAKPAEAKPGNGDLPYAQVWNSGTGGLEDLEISEEQPVDSNVWEKIIAERELEAKREAELNQQRFGRGERRRTTVDYSADAVDDLGHIDEQSGDEFDAQHLSESEDEEPPVPNSESPLGPTHPGSRQEEGHGRPHEPGQQKASPSQPSRDEALLQYQEARQSEFMQQYYGQPGPSQLQHCEQPAHAGQQELGQPILTQQQPVRPKRSASKDQRVCEDQGEAITRTNMAIQSALRVGFSKRKGAVVEDTFPLRQLPSSPSRAPRPPRAILPSQSHRQSEAPRWSAYASAGIIDDASMIPTAQMVPTTPVSPEYRIPTAPMGISMAATRQEEIIHANMSSVRDPSRAPQYALATQRRQSIQAGEMRQQYHPPQMAWYTGPPLSILPSNGPPRQHMEPQSTQAVENLIGSSAQAMQAHAATIVAALNDRGAAAMGNFVDILAQTSRAAQLRIFMDVASREVEDPSLRTAVLEALRRRLSELPKDLR